MGLKYYSNKLDNYDNFPPLSSDIDLSLYENTCISYKPSSSEIKKYTNTYNSIQNNIYVNIPKQSTYSALINTTTSKTDITENSNNQIYENVKLRSTSSSSHIYINLIDHEDKPPIIPKEDISLSSIHLIEIEQIDIETNILEKCSNTKQTVKKSEINMAPNCRDKSDLYRTKIPSTITRILPSIRQRRTLHRSRRPHRRSSTHFRTTMNSNTIRRQQQNSNQMNTNNRRKRSSDKSVSNQIYNRIQQPILSDNQSMNSFYTEEIFECPTQFHGALQNGIHSWYPTEIESIPQVFSTSENRESIQQDKITNQEEELCPHNTFEDFLLRRRPKSSSSTLASVTNTLISETISQEIPARPPPLNRSSTGISLSLDKNDVDFIHDIIQRTHGEQRISNRMTALREAYIRAADKRNDLLKIKTIPQIDENKNKIKPPIKHSMIASKIRNELERYDELPVHRRPSFDDDDDDIDDTYSTNEDYRYHHRRLPPVPSTGNRIINFVTTLKRQLQKNFHEIRSRLLIEMMSNRPISHNSSSRSHRYRPRSKTLHTNNCHSIEHSHRYQVSRTYSDTSHMHYDQRLSHRPRTFRVTSHFPQRQRMN